MTRGRRAPLALVRRAPLAAAGLAALLAVPVLAPGPAGAQAARRALGAGVVPEGRLEVAAGREPASLAGVGAFVDAGPYARVGLVAAGGVVWADAAGGRAARAAGEASLVARFLLDPLRQAPRGVYAGGGVGVRAAAGRGRPFLLGALGVEGRRARAGVAPALEIGVGGGARVSVVLRRARAGRR